MYQRIEKFRVHLFRKNAQPWKNIDFILSQVFWKEPLIGDLEKHLMYPERNFDSRKDLSHVMN